MRFRKAFGCILLLLSLVCQLTACGEVTGSSSAPEKNKEGEDGQLNNNAEDSSLQLSESETKSFEREDFVPYVAPEMHLAVFHQDHAVMNEDGNACIDISEVSEGFVSVSAKSECRLKFQVMKGEETYNYDISSSGEPSIVPLQMGNGEYEFRVMENISDSKYAEIHSVITNVSLSNEFLPYLYSSDYVKFDENSLVTKTAEEIASKSANEVEVVAGVFEYVCQNIVYDQEKAASVESGYLPDPDEILNIKKGICFDYASIVACMLRSQGIPTKMIMGYVAPDGLYHAWNMFYTEETGWVKAEYKVNSKDWTRLDLTFSSGGAEDSFVTDNNNYTDIFTY